MLRKLVSLIGLTMIISCVSDIPSVKILVQYEQAKLTASKSDDNYLIGPGDTLSIDIWDETDLSKQVSVRLDGYISLPLVNDFKVAGLTCTELRRQLADKYKKYKNTIDMPSISVTIVQSVNNKIYISGQVNTPGEYLLDKHMTILQAISRAGGLSQWADASDIRLIRKIKGVEKTFRVDYRAIVSGEDLSQNIQLKPDDSIYVP